MFRTLDLSRPSRRTTIVLLAAAAALLLALAATLEPSTSSRMKGDPGTTHEDGESTVGDPSIFELVGPTATGAGIDPAIDPAAEPVVGGIESPKLEDAVRNAATDEVAAANEISGGGSTLAPPELDAKIVRVASIALDVKRGDFEDTWGAAQAVATAKGGYIVAASRSGAGRSSRAGTITMRVPTDRFEAAIEQLRGIDGVKVGQLDVSSQDVTQEYVDVKSRLRHDRAVEARLITLLADADGVSEVLAVQARLDSVQEQIEVARGRLQYLDKLTAMSTISVSLTTPAAARADRDDRPGTLEEAFDDARERFTENVAAAVVWTGGALPTLLALVVALVVARVAWRRHAARTTGNDTPTTAA